MASIKASRALVEYLQDRAGEALRVVFHYDPRSEGYEILYMREDIRDEYTEPELERHFDTFRRDSHLAEVQEGELSTGNHHCSIRVFDETLLFNFTHGPDVNTIVSIDPMVGRNLLKFVADSLEHVYAESPDISNRAPRWV